MYKVIWSEEARGNLAALDRSLAKAIQDKIETYLAYEPRKLGEALQEPLKGLHKYRYRKYSVIYEIRDDVKEMAIAMVKPRDKAYKQK
jgi:mRNA-degrading endonuclease RelE of RelBE toxin-antitoxin system